jgi:hypothetical protein
MGTVGGGGGSFRGDKGRPGRNADLSPPSSAVVNNKQELYSPLSRLNGGSGTALLFYFWDMGNGTGSETCTFSTNDAGPSDSKSGQLA